MNEGLRLGHSRSYEVKDVEEPENENFKITYFARSFGMD